LIKIEKLTYWISSNYQLKIKMFRYIEDPEIVFKSSRYVLLVVNNDPITVKSLLDCSESFQPKSIFEYPREIFSRAIPEFVGYKTNSGNSLVENQQGYQKANFCLKLITDHGSVIIQKSNGKYYEHDHNTQININKVLSDKNLVNIVVLTNPDNLCPKIEEYIRKKTVIRVINNCIDVESIIVDYQEIAHVLLSHKLIGGRVLSFIGSLDNKNLLYVSGFDLKSAGYSGIKLEDVLTSDNYLDLCDHLIKLYKKNKNKPVPPQNYTSNEHNDISVIVNYYGNIDGVFEK
jgi:hypothetical protein